MTLLFFMALTPFISFLIPFSSNQVESDEEFIGIFLFLMLIINSFILFVWGISNLVVRVISF